MILWKPFLEYDIQGVRSNSSRTENGFLYIKIEMYAKTRAFSETSGRGLFCYAKRCAKKSKIKKKFYTLKKK